MNRINNYDKDDIKNINCVNLECQKNHLRSLEKRYEEKTKCEVRIQEKLTRTPCNHVIEERTRVSER